MDFNFTSQICTNKEQSERLLALGLKKKTADCQYAALVVDWKGNPISNPKWRFYDHNKGFIVQNFERMECYPAWSLHRLIEMIPIAIPDKSGITHFFTIDGTGYISYIYFGEESWEIWKSWNQKELYDSIIDCIVWLIKEGHFNKEYLEE